MVSNLKTGLSARPILPAPRSTLNSPLQNSRLQPCHVKSNRTNLYSRKESNGCIYVNDDSSYTVLLHFWDNVPAVTDPTQFRLFRSGHVALEVKKEGTTVGYVGWWPRSYTVQRNPMKKPLLRKFVDRMLLWFTDVEGRLSSYATVQDAKIALLQNPTEQITPDNIDSVLVGNRARGDKPEHWGTLEDWKSAQIPASKTSVLTGLDTSKLLSFIEQFRDGALTNRTRYQFFFNNCATVIAEALKRGGYDISSGPWWPSRLVSTCVTVDE